MLGLELCVLSMSRQGDPTARCLTTERTLFVELTHDGNADCVMYSPLFTVIPGEPIIILRLYSRFPRIISQDQSFIFFAGAKRYHIKAPFIQMYLQPTDQVYGPRNCVTNLARPGIMCPFHESSRRSDGSVLDDGKDIVSDGMSVWCPTKRTYY